MSSIQGVAVILAPNETVWHGQEFVAPVTDEDGSEDQARQTLMTNFARTILGPVFPEIDQNDAWHLWQVAEKNGYRIKKYNKFPILGVE